MVAQMMHYTISVREGRFDLANPNRIMFSNWVGVYKDGTQVKSVSVLANAPIFFEDDKPEDIAQALEKWLDSMWYTSQEEKVKEMIQFLREHSEELYKGKIQREIEKIDEQIEKLKEKKRELQSQVVK